MMSNQHRLQYAFVFDSKNPSVYQYDVRSFFLFNHTLVVLQSSLNQSMSDRAHSKSAIYCRLNYLIETFELTDEIKLRFHNKKTQFGIWHHDVAHRRSSIQLISTRHNHVAEMDVLAYGAGANHMIIEHVDHVQQQYVVVSLPEHRYIMDMSVQFFLSRPLRKLWRAGHDQLWLTDDKDVLFIKYHHKPGDETVFFRLYDDNRRMKEPSHRLSVMVSFDSHTTGLDSLTIEMGQMDAHGRLQDGVYIRFLNLSARPVIHINIIKSNVSTSLTYQLVKRSPMMTSVSYDDVNQNKLSGLLTQSRLSLLLAQVSPVIQWKDYGLVNRVESLYVVHDKSGQDSSCSSDIVYHPSIAPENTASIADLDSLLENREFCPVVSERFIDVMVRNIAQYMSPKQAFTQGMMADEATERAACITACADEWDKLMALQRHTWTQLQNNRRNKIEHEYQHELKQLNTKFKEAYLKLASLALLVARHARESEVCAEYLQAWKQLMLLHGEQVERASLEQSMWHTRQSVTDARTGFFEVLDLKRETAKEWVLQHREIRTHWQTVQRDQEQRRALQTREAEARVQISGRFLHVLNGLWRFNMFPIQGTYTSAQLFAWGNETYRTVKRYAEMLAAPCAANRNRQSILETLFLVEKEGWDVFMGGSASRGSPWANDLDIKLSPAHSDVTDEQRLKLFLLLQTLFDAASDVRGYPEKGLITFDILGLPLPVNVVIYLTYKGPHGNDPLYSDDVVVRFKRDSTTCVSSLPRCEEGVCVQFYRHQYHPGHAEEGGDTLIDLMKVAYILKTQQIHAHRSDPPGILRVLRDMAYCPDKERVNAEPLKALIANMQADKSHTSSRFYHETLSEFYDGKHKVAPACFQEFLRLLNQYGLPECDYQLLSTPPPERRSFALPTRYGYAHLIELLVERYQQQSVSEKRWTVLECIELVLDRQDKKALFARFCEIAAAQANGSETVQPVASVK